MIQGNKSIISELLSNLSKNVHLKYNKVLIFMESVSTNSVEFSFPQILSKTISSGILSSGPYHIFITKSKKTSIVLQLREIAIVSIV